MRTLQMLLGHADVKTTETYTFLPPSIIAEKLSLFGMTEPEMQSKKDFVQRTKKTPDNYLLNQAVTDIGNGL